MMTFSPKIQAHYAAFENELVNLNLKQENKEGVILLNEIKGIIDHGSV